MVSICCGSFQKSIVQNFRKERRSFHMPFTLFVACSQELITKNKVKDPPAISLYVFFKKD